MLRTRCLAALVVATVAAGTSACTAGPSPSASSAGSPSGAAGGQASAPTTSARPPAPPPPPRQAACYRLTSARLTRPADSSAPVPCSARHTARTIYVGRLRPVGGHPVAVGSAAAQRQLADTCPRRLAGYVGGSATTRALSRFNVVWFSPTPEQADRGADWFRCDLVAFDRGARLLALPPGGRLEHVLDHPRALDTYGLCGTAAPGATGFERVRCGRRHSWRAVATIPLRGGRRYPGTRAVRARGDAPCKGTARSRAGDPLRFSYGWEWPTADQWTAGQHFGYCWVPS